jgi:hypothetical protein
VYIIVFLPVLEDEPDEVEVLEGDSEFVDLTEFVGVLEKDADAEVDLDPVDDFDITEVTDDDLLDVVDFEALELLEIVIVNFADLVKENEEEEETVFVEVFELLGEVDEDRDDETVLDIVELPEFVLEIKELLELVVVFEDVFEGV